MKRIVVFAVLLTALSLLLVRCKLENNSYLTETVGLNLASWNLPDEAKVSVPFNLVVGSYTESSCYGKIIFRIETNLGKDYVLASSLYSDKNVKCHYLETYKDSTITITKTQAGKYFYYYLKDDKWVTDSIVIIP